MKMKKQKKQLHQLAGIAQGKQWLLATIFFMILKTFLRFKKTHLSDF